MIIYKGDIVYRTKFLRFFGEANRGKHFAPLPFHDSVSAIVHDGVLEPGVCEPGVFEEWLSIHMTWGRQTWPTHSGSSSLLVIRGHGSKIATSKERVANGKILVNQWRNWHSSRDWLSHHLVFTKNDEEPILFTSVRT
jgi:hypothetical protein